jgi:predicted nicotinamide N-methyase
MEPTKEKASIQERFDLTPIPVGVEGKRLEIYGIGNWDRFVSELAEKGEEYIKEFPFWIKFWEASFVLADDLVRCPLKPGSEVLEIGAGMGLTGLFLAAHGHRVTITDFDEDVLALLSLNAGHNGLNTVTVRRLDWLDPDLTGTFDVICGSEVVYQERFFAPMISLFHRYLKPSGVVHLAHNMRHECIAKFIDTMPADFQVEKRIKSFRGDGQVHRIVLHALRRTAQSLQ